MAVPETAFQINAFQIDAFQIFTTTDTRLLEKPVDYALAGDQDGRGGSPFRRGFAPGSALRGIFNE